MTKKLTLLLLGVLITACAYSQSLRNHIFFKDDWSSIMGRPKTMKTVSVSYRTNGEVGNKVELMQFDERSLPVYKSSLNDNGTVSKIEYFKYDTLKRLLLERYILDKNTDKPTRRVLFYYTYQDGKYPVKYQELNRDSVVVSETHTTMNAMGLPEESFLFEPVGVFVGSEKAIYFLDQNKVALSVLDNEGSITFTDTAFFSLSPNVRVNSPNLRYNERGDLIWSQRQAKSGTVLNEYDYIYDEKNNFIKKSMFKVTTKPNGKKRRELTQVVERTITYW
ncbi:hypothetical protein [Pedobacter sp. BAL39]|uniref:hypothetical protein n=1 Tax=Pedobacter sp. BAL39 TaxID=391596 RepID=UPI0012F79D12|nr:hypothetical protein [Pedobacter sp. BAL39]